MSLSESSIAILRGYFETDAARAAHELEAASAKDAAGILLALPAKISCQVFARLEPAFGAEVAEQLKADDLQKLAKQADALLIASIVMNLQEERRQIFIDALPQLLKEEVQELLSYPQDSAGRLMRHNYQAFSQSLKVKDTISKLRSLAKKSSPMSYVYVIDDDKRLVGVLNMRDLILAAPDAVLSDVMHHDVTAVEAFTEREELSQEFTAKRYFSFPVVDAERRLLGVVRAEDVVEAVQREAAEDIQQMFGAGKNERTFSPVSFCLKKRLPWLYVNLATAFAAAGVVAMFENIIAELTILAVFLPIVAGQGGNAGAQSLAVVMRGIVMREIPRNAIARLIWKESWIGVLNGVFIGLVTAGIAWLWQGSWWLGLVVGLAMLANLVIAGLAGAAIPLLMRAVRLDPAQSSSIILTTVTDVVGFFAFLGLAVIFRDYLLMAGG